MAQELIAALEAEIEALEAELRADIRYVRLQSLQQSLALYVDPDNALNQLRTLGSQAVQSGQVIRGSGHARYPKPDFGGFGATSRPTGRRTSVEKSQGLDAAAMLLRNRSGPVPTREILDHLVEYGIDVGGSSPLNNLSATLSNSDRFRSLGRNGWVLNEVEIDSKANAESIDPEIYRIISMEFLDEQGFDGISAISNHVQFTGELPDQVKDELLARFKVQTEYDYGVNSGNFQRAFLGELDKIVDKMPEADVP